jgi:hypothetical protein
MRILPLGVRQPPACTDLSEALRSRRPWHGPAHDCPDCGDDWRIEWNGRDYGLHGFRIVDLSSGEAHRCREQRAG